MRYGRFFAALAVCLAVAAFEVIGGLRAQSIGLIADAVHAATDGIAVLVMLAAMIISARPANRRKTFGYGRIEVLGAVFNGALLLFVTAVVAAASVHRLIFPLHPEGGVMAVVSAIALGGNLAGALLLLQGVRRSINARSAFLNVAGDALGSIAVLVAGLLVIATHHAWLDPAFSLLVCVLVVVAVWHMIREAADVLLEAVPRGVDIGEVERAIRSTSGVDSLHELHVWAIGGGANALSAHVLIDAETGTTGALHALRRTLRERFDVTHVTLQVERERCEGP